MYYLYLKTCSLSLHLHHPYRLLMISLASKAHQLINECINPYFSGLCVYFCITTLLAVLLWLFCACRSIKDRDQFTLESDIGCIKNYNVNSHNNNKKFIKHIAKASATVYIACTILAWSLHTLIILIKSNISHEYFFKSFPVDIPAHVRNNLLIRSIKLTI